MAYLCSRTFALETGASALFIKAANVIKVNLIVQSRPKRYVRAHLAQKPGSIDNRQHWSDWQRETGKHGMVENAWLENTKLENAGPNWRGGKCGKGLEWTAKWYFNRCCSSTAYWMQVTCKWPPPIIVLGFETRLCVENRTVGHIRDSDIQSSVIWELVRGKSEKPLSTAL